jgi:shikimate 5-dehydrogenase
MKTLNDKAIAFITNIIGHSSSEIMTNTYLRQASLQYEEVKLEAGNKSTLEAIEKKS